MKNIVWRIFAGIGVLSMLLLATLLVAYSFFEWPTRATDWVGTYYKDINDNNSLIESVEFTTYSDCKAWGDKLIHDDSGPNNANYTCGWECTNEDVITVSERQMQTYECNELIYGTKTIPTQPVVNTTYTSQKGVAITLYQPLENMKVENPVEIIGKIPGTWSFEATFPIELYDGENTLIGSHFATLKDDWMTEQPVLFTATLDFDTQPTTDTGKLILIKDNPSGLPENSDRLEISVRF